MKFLLVSPFTNASGSAIRFWNIAIELQKKGHEVIYVDRQAKNCSQLFHSDLVKYYTCFSTGNLIFDMIGSLFFNFVIFFTNMDCKIFYALKPAPNNCIPAFFAKILGKTVLLDVDDLDYAYLSGWKKKIFKVLFDFFVKRFSIVTYHTPNLKTYLNEKAHVPEKNLYYLAQGISQNFLDINIDSFKPVQKSLLYVATLGITSDFKDLLPGLTRLCKKHPDMQMDVVGDGCRKKEFEQYVNENIIGDQIRFVGKIDHFKLPEFIANHQIGINYMRPLEVNNCRAILKIREYLACGLHVVCNNVGDVDLFKGQIYIEPDLDTLLYRVDNLLNSSLKRNYNGEKLIKENYCWEGILKSFLENRISTVTV